MIEGETSTKILLTLYFTRSSFERDEDMILRRIDEGAEKCALRDLRRDEARSICRPESTESVSVFGGIIHSSR